MSALPPKADIDHRGRDVRFVPKADLVVLSNLLNCRDCPCTVKNGGRVFVRPVHAQHQDEFVGRRREPVRFLVGTGGLVLDVEVR